MYSGGRRTCEQGQEEGEGGGGQGCSVLRTSRRVGRRAGEGRGGRRHQAEGSYSARAHCSVLQSMHMAGMAILKGQGHVHLCPGASLDALEWSGARWGAAYRNVREREEELP